MSSPFVGVVAQLNITDGNTAPYNPNNLVRNIFLGSGVEVTSVQYTGDDRQVGFFSGGQDRIGVERGILLSTGFAKSVSTLNETTNDNGDQVPGQGISDPDLQAIAGDVVNDVALYTIKFIPAADTLRFRYVFSSEEYPEYICEINDVFGFFISGPKPDGGFYNSRNIAIIPDPSDPSGLTFTNTPVAINNVHGGDSGCPAQFPEYYNEVSVGEQFYQMNAYLDVFTAEAIVVPCEEYTIKLGVADANDQILNSVVFLEAKSFGTGTLEVNLNSLSVDGSLAEGCGTGVLEFSLPRAVDSDYIIDIELFDPPNAATPDVDYPALPDQLIIPAGSKSVTIPLEAYLDAESEMDEIISFEIQVDLCNRKKFEILIRDDDLFAPILPGDTTICSGEDYMIQSELDPNFNLPPDPFFQSSDELTISPENEPIYSDIMVSGVLPTILRPNIIESVCIQGLEHRDLTDFDIYLIAPGGQILELSTDNGFKTNNFADVDRYENTCFTPFATTNINNGENLAGPIFEDNPTYTGDFLPEGVWSDLWDGENPTNGIWRLLVIDDFAGSVGVLEGWSITFRSFYGLTYEWSSNPNSTLCENCEDITVRPSEETEYTLKIIDSYGCERSASTNVSVDPSLGSPSASCGMVSENSIEILWNAVVNSQGYEVRIDEGQWVSVSDLSYTFTTLSSSTDFEIEVRAVGPVCNSIVNGIECRTLDCTQPAVVIDIIKESSCSSSSDGEVLIQATGNGPFMYEINGLANSNGAFFNVPNGKNDYSVTDATGCTLSGDFEMGGPSPFDINAGFQLSDPCNVQSAIRGTVNVQGGNPPYQYQWSSGSTDKNAPNLTPGLWFVTISDDNGCDTIAELAIPQLEILAYQISSEPPLCRGDQDGKAAVEILSGSGPFTYLWEDGTSEDFHNNLTAGTYVVTVTDALGCSDSQLFTVDQGPTIDLMINTTDASCLGQEDGTATVTANGGMSPYSFIWSAGNSLENENTGLGAGTYQVTVSDINGCTTEQPFMIEEPEGISYQSAIVDNECFGASQGAISLSNLISPNGSVDVFWEDGTMGINRENLPSGTYCFTLSDGSVCDFTDCLVVNAPPEIIANPIISDPSCENSLDGSIELNTEGGMAPYNYNWTGPDGSLPSTPNISDLRAGEYFVTITDDVGCTVEFDYTIDPSNPIDVESTVIPVACFGETSGQILFAASGGNSPFSYEWLGPAGFEATTNNIQGVEAGVYTVRYTDNSGCSETQDFVITQPDTPLRTNLSPGDEVCFGSNDGSLSVAPQGGSPPYEIQWSNNAQGMNLNNLSPGMYMVTVSDAKGCEVIESAEVAEIAEIKLTLEQNPASCFEASDGSASIANVKYGEDQEDLSSFSYVWSTDPEQVGLEVLALEGGQEYFVTATDQRGCQGEASILIGNPDQVNAIVDSIKNISCFGGNDGSIRINGKGGTGAYTYNWESRLNKPMTNQIDSLSRGNYKVTITDENGCSGEGAFSVEEPRPLNLNFNTFDVSCFEGSDGRTEALVVGGTIPYEYEWSNGQSSVAVENTASDWYIVTITDANGCQIIDSTLIGRPAEPITASFDQSEVTCHGGRDGRIAVEASGGSGFYRYSIDGNDFSSNGIFTNLVAGEYTVYVNDFKGCIDTFTDVYVTEPNKLIVDLGEDLVIPFGNTIQLSPQIFNADGPLSYRWSSVNLDLLSCNICLEPIFDGQRESTFELTITDESGCTSSDLINIRLENFSPLYVPTAFTPNDDGENDVLELFGQGISIINRFNIYDRWGELVYAIEEEPIDDALETWDGIFKGEKAGSGLYFWFAEVVFENGFKEDFNGNVTLLR